MYWTSYNIKILKIKKLNLDLLILIIKQAGLISEPRRLNPKSIKEPLRSSPQSINNNPLV